MHKQYMHTKTMQMPFPTKKMVFRKNVHASMYFCVLSVLESIPVKWVGVGVGVAVVEYVNELQINYNCIFSLLFFLSLNFSWIIKNSLNSAFNFRVAIPKPTHQIELISFLFTSNAKVSVLLLVKPLLCCNSVFIVFIG